MTEIWLGKDNKMKSTKEAKYYKDLLFEAIETDDPELVRVLLYDGALRKTENSRTPFEDAMKYGSDEIISIFLSRKEITFTQLHLACLRNDLTAVELAVKNQELVNKAVSEYPGDWAGFTPLHFAAVYNRPEILKVLFDCGANINVVDRKNKTPLCYAVLHRNMSMIKLIMSILIGQKVYEVNEMPLLHVACMLRDPCFVKVLLEEELSSQINYKQQELSPNPEWFHFTPLHIAVRYNRLETAKLLLNHGADISLQVDEPHPCVRNRKQSLKNGITALHMAFTLGHKKMMELILSFHDGKCNIEDSTGISQFDIACSRRDPQVVKRFLLHHGEINRKDVKPFMLAMHYNRTRIVKVLIEYGFNTSYKHETKFRLLTKHCCKMISSLMREGIYNPCNIRTGFNILQFACQKGYTGLVEVLLKYHPTIDYCKCAFASPLHLAVLYRHKKIIKILLDYGARPYDNIAGSRRTVLEILAEKVMYRSEETNERYYYDVIGWLIEAGIEQSDIDQALRRCALNPSAAWALLQYGADINAVGKYGRTSLSYFFGGSSCFGDNLLTYSIFRDHILKMKTIGINISEQNEMLMTRVHKRYEASYTGMDIRTFTNKCEEECKKLKTIMLNKYTRLYDVIIKDPTSMVQLSNNEDLKNIITSENFDKEYPMYGYLIKLQCKKGTLRRPLMESAHEALSLLAEPNLPDACVVEIFRYLSDKNLRDLIKAKDVTIKS